MQCNSHCNVLYKSVTDVNVALLYFSGFVLLLPLDESPFFDNDMPTMRSSSSSSEGLPHMIGLSREASLESNEVSSFCTPSL